MANNRMSLRCKICGEEIVIAKYYPNQWYQFRSKLDEFFNEHQFCVYAASDEKLEELNCDIEHLYELIYEHTISD